MRIYYNFFSKFIAIFLIAIFIVPCSVLATDSEYVWSSDDITSIVNAPTINSR